MARHFVDTRNEPQRPAHGQRGPSSAGSAYKARVAEEVEDARRVKFERDRKFAAALRIAFGPDDGPTNLETAAKLLETRGRQHDREVAADLRRRASAIFEARALVAERSWNPPT